MSIKKVIITSVNLILGLATILLLLDRLDGFDIKNDILKLITYSVFILATPVVLVLNLIIAKTNIWKLIGCLNPLLNVFVIFSIGFSTLVWTSSAWETHRVLYTNKHLENRFIEQQFQYSGDDEIIKRTVDVIYLTKAFMIVKPVPADIDKHFEWTKIGNTTNSPDF